MQPKLHVPSVELWHLRRQSRPCLHGREQGLFYLHGPGPGARKSSSIKPGARTSRLSCVTAAAGAARQRGRKLLWIRLKPATLCLDCGVQDGKTKEEEKEEDCWPTVHEGMMLSGRMPGVVYKVGTALG